MEHEGDTNCNRWDSNDSQWLVKGAGSVGNWRTWRDDLNYCIVKICKNTEKSPGDLRRLAVTPLQWKIISWSEKLSKE